MTLENEISRLFREHVEQLVTLVKVGDTNAAKSLACLSLTCQGWRYGDPEPSNTPPDGGGEVIDLSAYRNMLAA